MTAIGKVPIPETEDDLRPISLTPFFSKVAEHFVAMWLMQYIGDNLDFRQYGGIKGNSITHYLIELINFILVNQDSTDQTAILACMVDFSKAFNRQNHNLLITKLSDMGVPAWLLKVVIAFLSDRRMIVRYKGKQSSVKNLPGGGPQGTLVLINELGFEGQQNNAGELLTSKRNMKNINQIHLKYVDDLTLAEAIDLDKLVSVPASVRPMPDNYHARTGHVLPTDCSNIQKQLYTIEQYTKTNEMKINYKKTKMMLFNPSWYKDFMPELVLGGSELDVVEEMRLLGVILTPDLKWTTITESIVKRAYSKLWMLRRLRTLGAKTEQLLDVYIKQVRSILELAVPAWHGALSQADSLDIERVQKCALHIILGDSYFSYKEALAYVNLAMLAVRREKLCLKFAKKAVKNRKHNKWFKPNKASKTRQIQEKYCSAVARTNRN